MITLIMTTMKFFNNSSSESEKRISSTKLIHNNRQAGLRGPPLSLVLGDPRSLRRKGPLWWLSFCPWQRFVPNNVRWIFTPDLILACGSDFCQMLGGFSHLGHRLISEAHALTSRFPCCVLSYFSLVFVVKHSRRW